LRAQGITAKKTIDTLIATRCMHDGYTLCTPIKTLSLLSRILGFDLYFEMQGSCSFMRAICRLHSSLLGASSQRPA